MIVLVKDWEDRLKHNIQSHEPLDYWIYDINEVHSRRSWYGLSTVLIDKYKTVNNEVKYTVSLEVVTELVDKNERRERILHELKNPTYDTGDVKVVSVFDTREDALDFASIKYPEIDVTDEVYRMVAPSLWEKINDLFAEKTLTLEDLKKMAADENIQIDHSNLTVGERKLVAEQGTSHEIINVSVLDDGAIYVHRI